MLDAGVLFNQKNRTGDVYSRPSRINYSSMSRITSFRWIELR